MAKYLWRVKYTPEGAAGVLKDGGTGRRNVVEKLAQNMGGSIESFYFSFGDYDAFIIGDFPSNVDVAAIAMTVGASGGASVETTVLLTPEDIDTAAEKTVEYRAPGA